jgi:hypothetical protein
MELRSLIYTHTTRLESSSEVFQMFFRICLVSGGLRNNWILCKIWGFNGGDYEECRLLWRGAVWILSEKSASDESAWSGGCRHLITRVPLSRIFLSWRLRRHVPPKRRFTQDLHGATSQKTAFLIDTRLQYHQRLKCCEIQHNVFLNLSEQNLRSAVCVSAI